LEPCWHPAPCLSVSKGHVSPRCVLSRAHSKYQ
jgi:hypothetical protein